MYKWVDKKILHRPLINKLLFEIEFLQKEMKRTLFEFTCVFFSNPPQFFFVYN